MGKPMAAEIETLKKAYAALNRGDVKAWGEQFDPEIVWIEPDGYAEGIYRGRDVLEAHTAKHRANWAEGGCTPEEFIVAGNKVVVIIYVNVRVKGQKTWAQGRHASVYTFKNGKAIEQRIIDNIEEALKWARANETDAD
jgi:ketosteroid isomerase-like protein